MLYPTPIAKLIESYSKLPGIGIKTATRLAFYTIGMSDDDVNEFAKNLLSAKRELSYCSICGNLTDEEECAICRDETRDPSTILVVEDSRDVSAMENIQEYHGRYHVLHGLISPMNGVGPDDINLKSLITRLMDHEVQEVIVATNATADGEAKGCRDGWPRYRDSGISECRTENFYDSRSGDPCPAPLCRTDGQR